MNVANLIDRWQITFICPILKTLPSVGTKITYNREMLLMLQQSPLSKSPLNLTAFPGLSKGSQAATTMAEPEVVRLRLVFQADRSF